MKIQKLTIKGSPFIGVFARTTETISLVPHGLSSKEKKTLQQILETEIIPCSLANSSLIGILAIGNQKGFLVPSIIEPRELEFLQERGIKISALNGVEAIGNLVSVNDCHGLCSPALSSQTIQKIEKNLEIKLTKTRIAESDLVGAACVLSGKGFVCNANANKTEVLKIQKSTRLKGNLTSANFGDPFIGNSILANSKGAVVGLHSTPHEIMAIEEALSGEA
ncbi:translation initiation factor IF-6 [Candidatus Micrarchaeota archaeon]|nr:translation initiation factor IF-6 [Candidatus Micrarchaeota archaeon]MBU1929924.1 translation initiation factor IF-6 [Candidatus Micrarchaeota archaeon]